MTAKKRLKPSMDGALRRLEKAGGLIRIAERGWCQMPGPYRALSAIGLVLRDEDDLEVTITQAGRRYLEEYPA